MVGKSSLMTIFLMVICSTLMGQDTPTPDNEPEFSRFDVESKTKVGIVNQPELILPNGNSYAVRIESDLSVDISGVTKNFLGKIDNAINGVIDEVTGGHLDGRVLLEQRGLQLDPLTIAKSSDVFLQQHTPILGGKASNITNYHLIAIIDLKPIQAEISHRWGEVVLGERLVQYIMIASVVLIVLFVLRGNQVMRTRDTNPSIRIVINVAILIATLTGLGVIATMIHWV